MTDVKDQLVGESRYHAIVSAYLLGICRRELAARGVIAPDTTAREQFCDDVKGGAWDTNLDDALAAALRDVISKVTVTDPEHLDPEHRQPAHESTGGPP